MRIIICALVGLYAFLPTLFSAQEQSGDVKASSDAFNYIEALQLLIVAIGIAKIIEGLAWLLEHRHTCRTYWVHTGAAILVGVLQFQYAWTSFYDYSIARWSFGDFLLQCGTPVSYLFVSALLFPASRAKNCDFRQTYGTHIQLIAVLLILCQVINSTLDFRFHPSEAHHLAQHIVRATVAVVLSGLFSPFPRFARVHEMIFGLMLIALLAFCLFLTPSIQI
jgi:hypothetical protein